MWTMRSPSRCFTTTSASVWRSGAPNLLPVANSLSPVGGGGGCRMRVCEISDRKGKEVGTKDLIRGWKRPMAGHVGFWMPKYDTFMSFSPDTEGEGVGEGGPAAGGGQGDEVVGGEGLAAGGDGQGDGSPGEIGGSDS